ncbi:hypothetical protein ACMFMG_007630 [Clarireedia jacksonii]
MSLLSNRSRPARRPGDPDLRGSVVRAEHMDPSAPQFVPTQLKHNDKESISSSSTKDTGDGAPSEWLTRAEMTTWFESKIADIVSTVGATTQISLNVRENLSKELQRFASEWKERENVVEYNEHELLRNRIRHLERELNRVNNERILKIKELERTIELQKEELDIKENQLNGKRLLWLASHPASAHQKALDTYNSTLPGGEVGPYLASARDLQHAATANKRLNLPPTSLGRLSKTSLAAMEGAVQDEESTGGIIRRLESSTALPIGSALPSTHSTYRDHNRATQPGTEINFPTNNMVVVPFQNPPPPPDLGADYTAEFTRIFTIIEGWCREYAHMVNPAQDRGIASGNQGLWTYMMRLTYPDPQSAHSHVMALLSSEQTRFWFVMRMAMTYCFEEIMHPKTFQQFNNTVSSKLKSIKDRLDAKPVPSIDARQELIREQSNVVEQVIGSPHYTEFRNAALMHHTKHLRDMLGPLLNKNCSRSKAGADLGVLVIACFDLGSKMWSARLSFQIIFPDLLGAKFVAGTMIAKDHPNDNPFQLQTKQKRLKLVMTPSITMRDDNSLTIIAKNLHKANVLLMT